MNLSPAPDLHCAPGAHGGVVMLDVRDGRWFVLNGSAGLLWRNLQSGRDLEAGVLALAERFPQVPISRLRADATALLEQLTDSRLVAFDPPKNQDEPEIARSLPAATGTVRTSTAAAFAALLLATLLLRLPFGRVHGLVRATCRRRCRVSLTDGQAVRISDAVDRAAVFFPGRAACLETSLAAVLLAALRRRHLDWCLGAVTDPYLFHAWTEAEGRPVREADTLPGLLKILVL